MTKSSARFLLTNFKLIVGIDEKEKFRNTNIVNKVKVYKIYAKQINTSESRCGNA